MENSRRHLFESFVGREGVCDKVCERDTKSGYFAVMSTVTVLAIMSTILTESIIGLLAGLETTRVDTSCRTIYTNR